MRKLIPYKVVSVSSVVVFVVVVFVVVVFVVDAFVVVICVVLLECAAAISQNIVDSMSRIKYFQGTLDLALESKKTGDDGGRE